MGIKQGKTILKKRIAHAKRRFKERHGLFLSDFEYCSLINQIMIAESQFLLRVSNNVTIHRVIHEGNRIPVVYSKRHAIILTAYQNKWMKKKEGKWTITYKPKRQKKRKIVIPWQLKSKWSRAKCEELGII